MKRLEARYIRKEREQLGKEKLTKMSLKPPWDYSKSMLIEEGRGGHWKANKNENGEGALAGVYVRFLKKKNAEVFKMNKLKLSAIDQYVKSKNPKYTTVYYFNK